MNKHSLRTKLALKIAPWLKPGEPRAREWKISGNNLHRSEMEASKRFPSVQATQPDSIGTITTNGITFDVFNDGTARAR